MVAWKEVSEAHSSSSASLNESCISLDGLSTAWDGYAPITRQ